MGDKPDTMRIWDVVCKTDDPDAHTKRVEYGSRKFTAIDAYSQIRRATELWGPVGEGWGWTEPKFSTIATDKNCILIAQLWLWYGDKERGLHCVSAVALYKGENIDPDAHKKVVTNCITKGLSFLGFNADVFLGQFEDNAYVQELRREARERGSGNGHDVEESAAPEPDSDAMTVAAARKTVKQAAESMHFALGDVTDMLQDWHQTPKLDALAPETRAQVVTEMTTRADLYGKMWVAYQQINAGHGLSEPDAIEGLYAWLLDQALPDRHPLRHPAAEWRDWLDSLRKAVPTQ